MNRVKNKKEIFLKKLLEKKGNSYYLLSEYKDANSFCTFKHSCGYVWDTRPSSLINHNTGCPKCRGKEKVTTSSFQQKLDNKYTNKFILKSNYVNAKTYVKVEHLECGRTFNISPDDLLRRGRCTLCSKESRKRSRAKTIEEYKKDVYNLVGDEYKVLSDYYFNWKTKIKFKHIICGTEFNREANSFLQGKISCPKCKGYLGELLVANILESNSITYEEQKSYKDLYYKNFKNKLKFDFYLPKENIMIEYNGKQHYEPIDFFGGIEEYKKQCDRDKLKEEYCIDNNITLVIIPYYLNTKEKIINYLKHKIPIKDK